MPYRAASGDNGANLGHQAAAQNPGDAQETLVLSAAHGRSGHGAWLRRQFVQKNGADQKTGTRRWAPQRRTAAVSTAVEAVQQTSYQPHDHGGPEESDLFCTLVVSWGCQPNSLNKCSWDKGEWHEHGLKANGDRSLARPTPATFTCAVNSAPEHLGFCAEHQGDQSGECRTSWHRTPASDAHACGLGRQGTP